MVVPPPEENHYFMSASDWGCDIDHTLRKRGRNLIKKRSPQIFARPNCDLHWLQAYGRMERRQGTRDPMWGLIVHMEGIDGNAS